jgi:hypothetical protein
MFIICYNNWHDLKLYSLEQAYFYLIGKSSEILVRSRHCIKEYFQFATEKNSWEGWKYDDFSQETCLFSDTARRSFSPATYGR